VNALKAVGVETMMHPDHFRALMTISVAAAALIAANTAAAVARHLLAAWQ